MSRSDTILLADDDLDLREILVTVLAEAGYHVLEAADGYDAVRILADNWVNLLITDANMAGIDGFDLARQARVMRPNIGVIYLSGYTAHRGQAAGPTYGPVLQKPIRMGDLLAEVSRQLA